ncbi:MAG: aminopeptidase [Candidatus Dormibacteraeota bacterium]|nr:aminopeptidase [Candidatus Dormibacteraeota bacterium]
MSDLSQGAANAVNVCMAVGPRDTVLIITDEVTEDIGHALAAEVELAGAPAHLVLLEEFTSRPAKAYPDALDQRINDIGPTVSFFAAAAKEGELALRRPLMKHLIYDLKTRHGHMVGITRQLMGEGMAADYEVISRLTEQVNEIVREAREVEVQAPSGTDMRVTLDPGRLRWHPCPGLYHEPGSWGTLPEGETYTSPVSIDGVIGAEVLGDHFSERYGVLAEPMRFDVENGRVRRVRHPDDEPRLAMEKYLRRHENSNRAGEFAVGTNIGLKKLSGNLLQDEKIPGVHVAFGYPYPKETGADWDCPSHCDVVATRSTIKVDGQYLMRDGEFVI